MTDRQAKAKTATDQAAVQMAIVGARAQEALSNLEESDTLLKREIRNLQRKQTINDEIRSVVGWILNGDPPEESKDESELEESESE